MTKPKILVLNEPEPLNGITWWRMYNPMRALELMYGDYLEIIWNRGVILPIDIERADIAIAWRPATESQMAVIDAFRRAGKKIILDYDDDFLRVPTGHPAFNSFWNTGHIIKKILSMADMVWTSTDELKSLYAHSNTHVIPNAVFTENIATEPNPITKTVMWRGDVNHYEDVYMSMDTYFRIARKADKFVWFGYMPTWDHPENAEWTAWRGLDDYFKAVDVIKPNFLWKPMRTKVPFNRGKSNIAKIEAICTGAVCLTNFYDQPTWEHSFREITWDKNQIFSAWESGREQIIREYNLESWTHTRYKLIMSLLV